jgi:hypothetical protein
MDHSRGLKVGRTIPAVTQQTVRLVMIVSDDQMARSSLRIQLCEDDVLFFLHLPKTGGLSLISILDQHFSEEEILPLHSAPTPELFDLYSPERLSKIRLVRGHFMFGPQGDGIYQHISQNPICLTMMREPVARTISQYQFLVRGPRISIHPKRISVSNGKEYLYQEESDDRVATLHREIRDMTLEEFVCDSRYHELVYNRQSRFILGSISGFPRRYNDTEALSEDALIQLGKERIERFAFLGLTERFHESVHLLTYMLGWEPVKEIPELNVSNETIKFNQLSKRTLCAIEERNRIDAELYRYAKELFDERLSRMIEELLEKQYARQNQNIPETKLQELEEKLARQQSDILYVQALRETAAWKFVHHLQALRIRLIPIDTNRERFYIWLRKRLFDTEENDISG